MFMFGDLGWSVLGGAQSCRIWQLYKDSTVQQFVEFYQAMVSMAELVLKAVMRTGCSKTALSQQPKSCVAFARAHSLQTGWTVEKWQKVDFRLLIHWTKSIELHPNRRPKVHPEYRKVLRERESRVLMEESFKNGEKKGGFQSHPIMGWHQQTEV